MQTDTKEKLPFYEPACSRCIDDLYHTACLALVDADTAEKIVTEICVAGVHKYDHLDDEAQIRFRLASDLYHRVKRRLWFTTPNTDALPEKLQVFTKQERLMIAIRLVSGLSSQEAGQICGFAEPAYKQILSTVMRKMSFVK